QSKLQRLNLCRRRPAIQVCDRFLASEDPRALMAAREKIRAPNLASCVRQFRREHDERGEILVFRAQTIAHPRTQTGPRDGDRTGMNAERGLKMILVIAMH